MEPTASGEERPRPPSVAESVAIVGLVRDKGQLKELSNMQTVHKWATHFGQLARRHGLPEGDAAR